VNRALKSERELPVEFETDVELIAEVIRLLERPERAALPRHRHDLSRGQVETAQRARIIVATAEVVTEVGYEAASVRAVIEQAGVSSKTFYALYGDKESAFFAAYTLLDGVVVAAARSPLSLSDPRATTRAGVRAFLQTLAQWPLFTRMHAVEARAAGSRVLERRTLVFREFVRSLSTAFRDAGDVDDRIDAPSDEVLMAVVGGIGELVLQRIVADGVVALPELEPTIVELIERVGYSEIPPD
jgi:AcrR family transcriptional regulator